MVFDEFEAFNGLENGIHFPEPFFGLPQFSHSIKLLEPKAMKLFQKFMVDLAYFIVVVIPSSYLAFGGWLQKLGWDPKSKVRER